MDYSPVNLIFFMKTLSEYCPRFSSRWFLWILGFWAIVQAQGQPSLVSVVPADAATGVSPSATVVFTFSDPMDTSATEAQFFDTTGGASVKPTPAWSAGDKVLTYPPPPA